ncbi:hypothetical protein CVT24_004245 [Panaeolus cyanescens]|uniref:Uncharacterized protein n=1 Tax=Panaeolus cyanescens TaxID=181874 RepID=A0A409VA75_9AGAR|nr:hypothetical protein CVT24_004245 [Panaeolus cyanescens]
MTTQQPNSFGSLLLRSSTPAPDEKVYKYLKGMIEAQPDMDEPRSLVDPKEDQSRANFIAQTEGDMYSPRTKSETLLNPMNLATLHISKPNSLKPPEDKNDDADSNVQEGMRSELGDFPQHEPDTHDPPARPKYASYDSGPSFGNFGPMPLDDQQPAGIQNIHSQPSWNPDWQNILNNGNGHAGGSIANSGLNGGLPEAIGSPRQTQSNIDAAERRSTKSRASPTKDSQAIHSPKQSSRAPSKVASYQGEQDQRPLSPMSARSRQTGTAYPPLPESRIGDNEEYNYDLLASPRSRAARSKAHSISPSDSITNISPKPQRVDMYAPKSNGSRPPSVLSGGAQNRPFSPYRHAPTQEDLLNAAVRNRALVIPEVPEESGSRPPSAVSKSPSKASQAPSKRGSQVSKQPSHNGSNAERSVRSEHRSEQRSEIRQQDRDATPTPRARSPEALDAEETRMVNEALAARTPRTSYYAASLEPEVTNHYHDMELCVLLHQESDPNQHDVVKKALRKAVRQRIKKLGMKYDAEARLSIKQYRKSYHDHDPSVHLRGPSGSIEYNTDEPPKWAADLKRELVLMQQRIESLGPKIENLKADHSFNPPDSRFAYGPDDSTRTPQTQTVNIQTGTVGDSLMHPPGTEMLHDDEYDDEQYTEERTEMRQPYTEGETRSVDPNQSVYGDTENGIPIGFNGADDSTGQEVLEHELYKLKQTTHGSQTGFTHGSWNIARENDVDEDEFYEGMPVPTIPDTNGDEMENVQASSPPLPALPLEADQQTMSTHPQGPWNAIDYSANAPGDVSASGPAPWQRVHQRLLNWALIWPMSEIETALNSTTRGQQVNEVALSIWTTQTYKRYVRARLTDSPPGVVDRLFVPPNIADAINVAVYNGRHADASQMLRDLWAPFGFDGTPRLLVVLAKHQTDPNHWVVHRFCLKEANLSTYDCYPGKSNLDGRPLGWWFAIRVAWPSATYPPPDKIVQKMVRLHRPMQLPIDNAVGAAGIWRNILMGSRAERSLDLERLRDLINTEVKNLKQRKHLGKLSIPTGGRAGWDERD